MRDAMVFSNPSVPPVNPLNSMGFFISGCFLLSFATGQLTYSPCLSRCCHGPEVALAMKMSGIDSSPCLHCQIDELSEGECVECRHLEPNSRSIFLTVQVRGWFDLLSRSISVFIRLQWYSALQNQVLLPWHMTKP